MKLRKRKLLKRLESLGTSVDITFMVYINNNAPQSFSSEKEAFSYINMYRDNNVIFNLGIYRIETFSL